MFAVRAARLQERDDQPRLRLLNVGETDRTRVVELARDHGRVHERRPGVPGDQAHAVGVSDRAERVPDVEVRVVLGIEEVDLDVGQQGRDGPRGVGLEEHARLPHAQLRAGVPHPAADGHGRDHELIGVADHLDVADVVELREAADVEGDVRSRHVNRARVARIGPVLVDVEEGRRRRIHRFVAGLAAGGARRADDREREARLKRCVSGASRRAKVGRRGRRGHPGDAGISDDVRFCAGALSGRHGRHVQLDLNGRACAGRGRQLELAAARPDPFTHAQNAEVSSRRGFIQGRRDRSRSHHPGSTATRGWPTDRRGRRSGGPRRGGGRW